MIIFSSSSPLLFKPLTVDLIVSVAKKTFGNDVEVTVYQDLQTDHPNPVDAAWLFFFIRKPLFGNYKPQCAYWCLPCFFF